MDGAQFHSPWAGESRWQTGQRGEDTEFAAGDGFGR
jgi:hypothetical protein